MAANDWLMQTVADQLRCTVERPVVLETTAWGAARLAGMQAGVYPPLGTPGLRQVERTFAPAGTEAGERLYEGWKREVGRAEGEKVRR
jgi:glycerol kinase